MDAHERLYRRAKTVSPTETVEVTQHVVVDTEGRVRILATTLADLLTHAGFKRGPNLRRRGWWTGTRQYVRRSLDGTVSVCGDHTHRNELVEVLVIDWRRWQRVVSIDVFLLDLLVLAPDRGWERVA